ncbi:MAG: hypothetical protein R3C53_05820 [Pirellulaceae bacterium]
MRDYVSNFAALSTVIWRLAFVLAVQPPLSTAFGQLQLREEGVVRFASIEDVIEEWSPDKHVYVSGNLGVGSSQLAALNKWIGATAPHWTVVLMESGMQESFRAADGRTYSGLDAVEHALGNGLSNRTQFGALEHPTTGERDGAVFALFLKERQFSYFASDAQDRRGLGEAHWIGQLDQPAYRAMRSGGRIIDAAKDTIQSIHSRLQSAIQSEADAQQRAARERERAAAMLQQSIVVAKQHVGDVRLAAANLRLVAPTASGVLANPPVMQWQAELESLEQELTPNTARPLTQKLAKTSSEVEGYLNAYAVIADLDRRTSAMQPQLTELLSAPNGVAQSVVAAARSELEQAQAAAQAGDLGIDAKLAEAERWIGEGQALVRAEVDRIERKRRQVVLIRRTILAMLMLAAIALGVLLYVLNLRRRPAMREALQQFALRSESVREETDNINVLFERNDEILGGREGLERRGYEGATQILSQQAIDYVDDLFIMSKETRRVLSEAKELIHPRGVIGKLVNLFSSSRYQQALNQVTGKPLKFTKRDGLPLVLRDRIQLKGDGTVPDEITMTFEDVFSAFQQRGDQAETALNTIEDSLASIHDTLTSAQGELQGLVETEKTLTQAAEQDLYFQLPNFFESLIPSIQADLAEADRLSAFDAVQAMQTTIPLARRKMSEAKTLANHLSMARQSLFPRLKQASERLRELQYATEWIDQILNELGSRANHVLKQATESSVSEQVTQIAIDLEALDAQSAQSVSLAINIDEALVPELNELSQRIETARASLAKELRLDPSQVLNELDRDPDDWLSAARKQIETARNTLSLGRNDVSLAALDASRQAAERASNILNDSVEAASKFSEQAHAIQADLERTQQRLPQVAGEVRQMHQVYETSTFDILPGVLGEPPVLQPGASQPVATVGAAELVAQAVAPLEGLVALLKLAEERHQRGAVLAAADIQTDAQLTLDQSNELLDRVNRHMAAIHKRSRQNLDTLVELDESVSALAEACRDPLITASTQTAVNQLQQSVAAHRRRVANVSPAPNPFQVEYELAKVLTRLAELQSSCVADRQAHAEASRAVAGAKRQLQAAQQLVERSESDGIPDSRLTSQIATRIGTLSQEVESLQSALSVAHGNWCDVDDEAARLQVDLRKASDALGSELEQASRALESFQAASKAVFQAEQWSGPFGINVSGAPGVRELERARSGLQQGNYAGVHELSRIAAINCS